MVVTIASYEERQWIICPTLFHALEFHWILRLLQSAILVAWIKWTVCVQCRVPLHRQLTMNAWPVMQQLKRQASTKLWLAAHLFDGFWWHMQWSRIHGREHTGPIYRSSMCKEESENISIITTWFKVQLLHQCYPVTAFGPLAGHGLYFICVCTAPLRRQHTLSFITKTAKVW